MSKRCIEIGNNFAISSGGIGDALQRSASSLLAANNTLVQSIALITAANTVVQDPDSVGTAFKTISMRIRGAKTELEEASLDTEGMAESTAKLREEIMALSGVDIMLDENTFKSTYDIMDELAAKWQDLTDIQQASITELIAGKRQGNVISSLMGNFDIARAALETSINSDGSATTEHAKWMESLQAKLNQLQAAWEELSQSFMDDGFLKGAVDTGTDLLSILTDTVDTFGTIPTLIMAISAAMSFKNIGVFSTIEDEASLSGLKIKSIFSDVFNNINNLFSQKSTDTISFSDTFSQNLQLDVTALQKYQNAISNNINAQEAFNNTMTAASPSAQKLAQTVEITSDSIKTFTIQQKQAELSVLAQNKSLSNIHTLLNTYNNGLENLGLTQKQFVDSVGKSNSSLGKYLSGLNGANASMKGYVGSLIAGKAATIGLQIATTALNTVIGI